MICYLRSSWQDQNACILTAVQSTSNFNSTFIFMSMLSPILVWQVSAQRTPRVQPSARQREHGNGTHSPLEGGLLSASEGISAGQHDRFAQSVQNPAQVASLGPAGFNAVPAGQLGVNCHDSFTWLKWEGSCQDRNFRASSVFFLRYFFNFLKPILVQN